MVLPGYGRAQGDGPGTVPYDPTPDIAYAPMLLRAVWLCRYQEVQIQAQYNINGQYQLRYLLRTYYALSATRLRACTAMSATCLWCSFCTGRWTLMRSGTTFVLIDAVWYRRASAAARAGQSLCRLRYWHSILPHYGGTDVAYGLIHGYR
eukprot:2943869-Rhodomonas_salina.3